MRLVARNPSATVLAGIWDRILKIAQGAALMTETSVEVRNVGGAANILPNEALARVAQRDLEEVHGFSYTPEERRFAEALQKSLPPGGGTDLNSTATVRPLQHADPNVPSASTDVGDVSWNVPTIGFRAATFASGAAPHTWQAAACAGMSIGQRGMVVAAKALALTAADLFADRQLILDAKVDFARQTAGQTYKSVIPEGQKPPLDYRGK